MSSITKEWVTTTATNVDLVAEIGEDIDDSFDE